MGDARFPLQWVLPTTVRPKLFPSSKMDDQQAEDVFNRGREYVGPVSYNFEPVRQRREEPGDVRVPQYRQEMEAWSQNNLWRVGVNSWYDDAKLS